MASMTVRNLPDEVHRALQRRAAAHGRSAEAEVRAIITDAVQAGQGIKLGSLLVDIGREAALTDTEVDALATRDRSPAEPMVFG